MKALGTTGLKLCGDGYREKIGGTVYYYRRSYPEDGFRWVATLSDDCHAEYVTESHDRLTDARLEAREFEARKGEENAE